MGPSQILNLDLLAFWARLFFVVSSHPVNLRMFNSISDLFSLGSITPF